MWRDEKEKGHARGPLREASLDVLVCFKTGRGSPLRLTLQELEDLGADAGRRPDTLLDALRELQ